MALTRYRAQTELPDLFRRLFDFDWDTSWLRVEEFIDGQTRVIRAELPDIDPDHDVELSLTDGLLHIRAERHEKTEHRDKESYRSEFRYGSFVRNLALPEGTRAEDIHASYKDGVLEIRVTMPEETKAPTTKLPITRG